MTKFKLCTSFLIAFIIVGCGQNPFTGKSTLALVPNSQILPMSFEQYNQVLEESKVIKEGEQAQMIQRVGLKVANASERWLAENGYPEYTDNYKWEFNLIDDEQVNAWAMPGGKIAFYTGILPIAENEAGVAAIMGHEVAHALANHGQQRMSAGQIQQAVGAVGTIALGDDQQSQQIFATAYGLGSQVGVMLPFSRKHETEADEIGIKLMAIAGYDPDEAAKLWMRMKENSGGGGPPQFMSTHPSNDSRIQNLKNLAEDAKKEAAKFGVTSFQN
ncbi:M48 family metallopeptidase [Psychroflexus montanilacus]|uniref:M48 family metallopeptidase n=1 Tax=Psychroflexus montanilacus TaxID=2873598 RepID=UPI001CCA06A1|nr:M48 family metallopeptidase [Psychroflexus montanilacus]MBZ9651288.1 M48 family metallopeptidase [Psychroflexus montanilacus]